MTTWRIGLKKWIVATVLCVGGIFCASNMVFAEEQASTGQQTSAEEQAGEWRRELTPSGDWDYFWYENGVKQGTEGRGKEIYDPKSNAWYWLDAVNGGAMARNKDVYQETLAGEWGDKVNAAGEKIGKWVRYDAYGHMLKGWTLDGLYFFDRNYGTMAKGTVLIDGVEYTFDESTGVRQSIGEGLPQNGWYITMSGDAFWYENGVKQGTEGRGKEIYDADSDAWYWLDAVDGGKKAVSKDVYQESLAGDWGDKVNEAGEKIGKWVRYDQNGNMVKGWTWGTGCYYFDRTYGTMAKGECYIPPLSDEPFAVGTWHYFDEKTGLCQQDVEVQDADGNWHYYGYHMDGERVYGKVTHHYGNYYYDPETGNRMTGNVYYEGAWHYHDPETGRELTEGVHIHDTYWDVEAAKVRTMKCKGCDYTGITEYAYDVDGTTLWGYFDEDAAAELFGLINEQRNKGSISGVSDYYGNGIAALCVPSIAGGLDDLAKKRALKRSLDTYDTDFLTDGEVIGDKKTATAVFENWWYFSSASVRGITSLDMTKGGAACFLYDADDSGFFLQPKWVVVLNYQDEEEHEHFWDVKDDTRLYHCKQCEWTALATERRCGNYWVLWTDEVGENGFAFTQSFEDGKEVELDLKPTGVFVDKELCKKAKEEMISYFEQDGVRYDSEIELPDNMIYFGSRLREDGHSKTYLVDDEKYRECLQNSEYTKMGIIEMFWTTERANADIIAQGEPELAAKTRAWFVVFE